MTKNILSQTFIIHQKLDKELKIDNSVIANHFINNQKKENPFPVEWEVNIGRIFQHQMEKYDVEYKRYTFLLNLNAIVLNEKQFYQKDNYLNNENLLDSPDMTLIYHASGNEDLKIRFTHSFQRIENREYNYNLKVGELVMFNSGLNHLIFNSLEQNTLFLAHYQHQRA